MKLILKIIFATGFALASHQGVSQDETIHADEYQSGFFTQVFHFPLPDVFNPRLYDVIYEWLGTPYRYAGKSISGIDCSGLVQKIYEKVYGLMAHGNSRILYNDSKRVAKKELAEGDLVFFRTRRNNISHVGIYLGENKFVHSSRTNGVIISDLTQPYYKKYFAGAGRLTK